MAPTNGQTVDATHPRVLEHLTTQVPAFRFSRGILSERVVSLAKEIPFTLFVNDREILSIATLPTNLAELFVGFLISEAVLIHPEELLECVVDEGSRIVMMELAVPVERLEKFEGRGMLTSGCAGGQVFSTESAVLGRDTRRKPLHVSSEVVLRRMNELDTHLGVYSLTRGVHAASLADETSTLVILEDLGRHNAVDKIVGYCFLNGVETKGKLLLTTGRVTSEMLTKAARGGFPMVISRSSASTMAISMAKQAGIDVITYVRAGRFDYFSHGAVHLSEEYREKEGE